MKGFTGTNSSSPLVTSRHLGGDTLLACGDEGAHAAEIGPPRAACGAITTSQRCTSIGTRVWDENSWRSSIFAFSGQSGVSALRLTDRLGCAPGRRLPTVFS